MTNPCIDDAELGDLLAGRIGGDRAAQVESHVAACLQCQTRLERVRLPVDSLVAAARRAGVCDPVEKEPELSVALSAIGRFRSLAGKGNAESGALGSDPTRAATPEIRNYRLIEKLGEGGMGTVYRAVHMHLEKTVALKIMKADRSGNPQAVSRFEREMKAIGRLEHPHIVRALDAGEQQGVYFLVMEYVAGIDLDQLIRSLGPLPVAEACEIVRQAALGLAHAHEHNLVHRDVKPSNLMLSPEGQVKVLDLGLAQFQQSTSGGLDLTIEGQMIGTLLYMSPEQLAGGKNIDHRSDIFSLGVTLYCLLAGGLPLERGQPAAMLPEIGRIRSDIPPDLAALLPQLLAASPDDRIGSMAQLAERLKPLAVGRLLTALLGQARKQPLARTALPPALLPSRAPPVQLSAAPAPAAQVSTLRAQRDPTLVAPASRTRLSAKSLAASPLAGWIAAGLATTALAVVVIVMNQPERQAPPVMPGTLVLTSADPSDARLPALLAEQPIRVIDATGRATALLSGSNSLPPGAYRLEADAGELKMPVSHLTIEAGQTQSLALVLPALVVPPPRDSWDFATIPDVPGPFVRYVGQLWYQGMPTEQPTTFRLTLRAKDERLIGQVKHRWVEIEAVTQAASGDYTERGLLLIDSNRYQNDRDIVVKEGWISAESESLRERLAKQFADQKVERLVVEYDRNDRLSTRAKDLNVYVPTERLSVQQVLVLLLGGSIPTAPEPLRKSRVLVASDGPWIQERAMLKGAWCDVLRSGPIDELDKPGAKGYMIATNPNVSFGLVRLRIANPTLNLNCTREHSSNEEAPSPPDDVRLADEARLIAGFQKQKLDPIGISLMPAAEGALASYSGELERGPLPKIGFEAHVRTAGALEVDGIHLRALEIRAVTDDPDNASRHVEEAWIRFDVNRYQQDDQFVIHDGWFRVQGETFPFDPDGVLLPVEDNLVALGKRLPLNRLSVHDVLGLLFDARLQASTTGNLRSAVQLVKVKTGQEGIQSETQAPLRGKPSVTADLYTFPKKEGWPLDYVICRSPSLPFDFYTVDLHLAALPNSTFSIKTALTNYENSGAEPLLGNPEALRSAVLATNQKIKEKLRDPNVRVWRKGNDALFVEFAGTAPMSDGMRLRTAVFLAPPGTTAIADTHWWFLDESSKADQEWVSAGRFWGDSPRAQFVTMFRTGQKTTVRRSGENDLPLESFSPGDQVWIKRQMDLRRWAELQVNRKK